MTVKIEEYKSILNTLPGILRENVALAKSCWFNVGGNAKLLYKPLNTDDLSTALSKARDLNIPYYALGVGSNLLVRDTGINGLVIKLGKEFNYIKSDNNLIEVGAAVLDYNLAHWALEHGFTNFEFLVGIPGTIGGALAMNAGCYGIEIKDILAKAEIIDQNGNIRIVELDELKYSYRKHNLGFDPIFTRGWFKIEQGNKSDIKKRMDHITAQREQTQPVRSKTGGSTFKNPDSQTELKAWQLIDQAGLRGHQIGGAQISEKHCNFLINLGNATAQNLEDLGELARQRVFDKFGINLAWEIKIIGDKL